MGFYLPIETPRVCAECPCYNNEGFVWCQADIEGHSAALGRTEEIPDWCPAVEVPTVTEVEGLVPLNQTIDDVVHIIHQIIYDFLINTDPESEYMTDKHNLLLKVNKTLCNEIERMKKEEKRKCVKRLCPMTL